jgi:D-glycero-alpha-D-manno-heptose-7-phosphate kinase
MLLSKTPLRISFAGGGSDYFNLDSDIPGRVIVSTINKYMFVCLNNKYNNEVRAAYSTTENVINAKKLKHEIIRESLKLHKIYNGLEISTLADIPSSGSGLASSSALSVGLAHVLRKFKKLKISKKILALEACEIEINKCKKPIGMQDQYSTSFGGLNRIEFYNNKKVKVTNLKINKMRINTFENSLMLFYTGINRKAHKILHKIKKSGKQFLNHEKLANLALNFEKELINGNTLDQGKILHEGWLLKRGLDKSVSSLGLDEIYKSAISAGAIGGKILGAGGGGYFLFIVNPKNQFNVKKRLKKLKCIDFKITNEGSEIFEI